MHIAIVGLPNSGKTSVFNALTGADMEIDPRAYSTQECTTALSLPRPEGRVEVTDTPSLCRGAGLGEGLGNAFLREVAEADVMLQVIRAYGRGLGPSVDPDQRVDPFEDAMILDAELALADVGIIREWLESGGEGAEGEAARAILSAVEHGQSTRTMGLAVSELEDLIGISLITAKPLILLANVDEEDLYGGSQMMMGEELLQKAAISGTPVLVACARLEADSVAVQDLCDVDAVAAPLVRELTGEDDLLTRVLRVCETMRLFPT